MNLSLLKFKFLGRTGIEGSNPYKYARAYTDINAEKNLPGGYMGVQPIMYNSSGNAVATGTWSYSSSDTSGTSNMITYTGFSGSPAVYSKGYVKIWNGIDYWTYNTFASPNLNDYT